MNNHMLDNITSEDFKRMHMHMDNSIKALASVHDHNLLNNNNNHNTDIHNMRMHMFGPPPGPAHQHFNHPSPMDDDGNFMEIDPLTVFSMDDYRKWNLDIKSDRITQLWDGKSESYES